MAKVVFVVGASRSGTSVLAEALGRHPEVFATEELHFYNLLDPKAATRPDAGRHLVSQLCVVQDEAGFFAVKNGEIAEWPDPPENAIARPGEAVFPAYLDWLARREGASVIVEHTPMNLYYRERIRAEFAQAGFLLMKRDPRAILASQKRRWIGVQKGARDIPDEDIQRVRWSGHPILQLLMLRPTLRAIDEAANEPDVLPVVYEELVRKQDDVLSGVSGWLGLAFDRSMTEVSDSGSSHSGEEGRTGFDPARLESWKKTLSVTETWLVERFFHRHLQQSPSGANPSPLELAMLLLTFPVATAMAAYYSSKSYGNLFDAMRKRFL
ncbi:MAG: sulfotransferase [Erythrobacter sp.]|uniref:sulfotransferase family protein n=1 Tax=Erythrobacter sp. TaxID=1042 RepID=UPI0032ED3629